MSHGVVIVGASQAGLQVAVSLRSMGYTAPVTIVGAESDPPYQRPPLSKAYLKGTLDLDAIRMRTDAFFEDASIKLELGQRIAEIDLNRGQAVNSAGGVHHFEHLALTVGARPRRLDLPGTTLPGVHYLRDRNDADTLRARLGDTRSVVVIGGGFVGLEAATAMHSDGRRVTVVENASRLMSRVVAPPVSDFYAAAHRRRGLDVRLGTSVTALRGETVVDGVVLEDQSVLDADLVLIGVGVTPRTELAEQAGLKCDDGIVVDEFSRTSDPRVVAAGDCTRFPDLLGGGSLIRLESQQNAIDQAKVAASTIMSQNEPYTKVPWFWSDQGDLQLQTAGLSHGYDRTVTRGHPECEAFSVLYFRDDRLLAIDSINAPVDYLTVREALRTNASIHPDDAKDASTPLEDLVRRR